MKYTVKRFSAEGMTKRILHEIKKNPISTAALAVSTANASNNIIKANRDNKFTKKKEKLLEDISNSIKKKSSKKSNDKSNIILI